MFYIPLSKTKIITISEAINFAEEILDDLKDYEQPNKGYLISENGDLRIMPCYIPNKYVFGAKLVTVFPKNKAAPVVNSMTVLFDAINGETKCMIDSTWLTTLRTGAIGAIAAKRLSHHNKVTATLIGAGVQGVMQALCLKEVKKLDKLFVCDLDLCKVELITKDIPEAEYAFDLEKCCKSSDIIITSTPSRYPIIFNSWVKDKGSLILAIGADAPGKQELEIDILTRENSKIVCDSFEQAKHSGEINKGWSIKETKELIAKNYMADLNQIKELISKDILDESTMIFDSTGIAALDIAFADEVLRKYKTSIGY